MANYPERYYNKKEDRFTIMDWALFIIVIDFAGFIGWNIVGQIPPDQLYIGTITAHIIHLFV